MNYYIDITLIPGADIDINFLLEKAYQRIHIGLTYMKTPNGLSTIGVAFPEYDENTLHVGAKLRLLAPDQATLENFNAKKYFNGLTDYVHITSIRQVPAGIESYVRYKRQQSKSNTARLARRKAKRDAIEFEEALHLLKDQKEVFLNAPFIKVSSERDHAI